MYRNYILLKLKLEICLPIFHWGFMKIDCHKNSADHEMEFWLYLNSYLIFDGWSLTPHPNDGEMQHESGTRFSPLEVVVSSSLNHAECCQSSNELTPQQSSLKLKQGKNAFQSTGFLCYLRYLLLSLSVVFCFQAPLLIKLLMLHKILILLTHI